MLFLSWSTNLPAEPQPVVHAGSIEVSRLCAPPTPPVVGVAAVYLWIENAGSMADRLIAVSSPMAASVEIHRVIMNQGLMQMRQVSAVDLPRGTTVKIEPGNLHLMLQGLKRPLNAGSAFPLTLAFRDAGMLVVQVPVKTCP